MEPSLILAQQMMDLIRNSGTSKVEARAAIEITSSLLTAASDIRFDRMTCEAGFPDPEYLSAG